VLDFLVYSKGLEFFVYTFMASKMVLRIIVIDMAYSKPGELTNHQILYCTTFFGIYRFFGLAFKANFIHFLFKKFMLTLKNKHKTQKF
jgi:hypothetical protein